MSFTPEIPPLIDGARLVLFVAYPDMGLLDLSGPQTAFWAATEARGKRGSPGYVRATASLDGGLVRSAEGVVLDTRPLSDFAEAAIDTLIVPGSPRIEQVLPREAALTDWLRRTSARARRTTSVCSGAFLLAQAGLLHDRRAATHWAMCDMLQARFPTVRVDRDAIFIRQDPVWTSAGVTAGIDLALALIEDDCGHDVAMDVARELVVFLKRPGGQSQFSETLQAQAGDSETFEKLHLWLLGNLGARLS
ncbi:MAG: GlxA family transcriptional regulator, partial [Phreatobacter sp.]